MSTLPRFFALSFLLLLTLLLAALGAQAWLRQQERRLETEAGERQRRQVLAAVEITGRTESGWTEARLRDIAALAGVSVAGLPGTASPEAQADALQVEPGVWLAVESTTGPATRVLLLSQRLLVVLGVLALALLVALIALVALRRPGSDSAPTAWSNQQRDVLSLAQLAQTSVSQQEALNHERDERLRAEGEARLRLQLLNRALEEKIRIGRDLHDGVIQSLYAAGLTLQSAQVVAGKDPAAATRRIESTVDLINRTIAEIRAYIAGLSPLSVRGNSIARALEDIVDELRAEREVECTWAIDESAASRLSDDQITDTLQIVREATSNALRHGECQRLSVALRSEADDVVVRVEDNGRGFDPSHGRVGGHGLANMRARAERGGGRLQIDSAPTRGTQLELTWTVSAPS